MTEHLKILNLPPCIQYTGNGAQTVFTYPFAIFQSSDLAVTINDAPQTNNHAVTGAGNTTGGSVIFDNAPANGAVIALERRLPLQRVSDFLEGGELAANALNNEFDYQAAALQQVSFDQNFMLRLPKGDDTATTLPAKAARANKAFGFDHDGAIALLETADTYATPTVTQSGTGAIPRGLDVKAKEIVSVRDFGALGDDANDDLGAIQNALDAHDAVYLPPGVYRITGTLYVAGGKKLCGAGASSVIKASSNAFDALAVTGGKNTLRDFAVENGDAGLIFYGGASPCTDNAAQNLVIRNAQTGILLDGYDDPAKPCAGNRFADIAIEDAALNGVHIIKSSIGAFPSSNGFVQIRVTSDALTGAAFFPENAKYNNAFVNCEASVGDDAVACFRIGGQSDKTLIVNLQCEGSNGVPNIQLDSGSIETSILNLYSNSDGPAILDNSGGQYTAYNAGFPHKNKLQRSHIDDATIGQLRFGVESVAFGEPNTAEVNLSKSVYIVDATNGETTVELPAAATSNAGAVILVKKYDASNNAVLITEDGGPGPDGKTIRLGAQHDVAIVFSDGGSWRTLSSSVMPRNAHYVDGVSTYVPDVTRRLHLVSASGGAVTVELPPANAAQSVGRLLTIKKTDASGNAVTVSESGGSGPDGANKTLTARYHAITLMSDGGAWHVLNRYTA